MTDAAVTKRRLADQIRLGDEKAWESFVRANFRTVATFLARILQDEETAGRLTSQTFARALERIGDLASAEEPLPLWLLARAKDSCFDNLPSDRWKSLVFSRAQEVFSTPPALRAVPGPVIDSDSPFAPAVLNAIYDGMAPEHELFLELVFIERLELAGLAELFGISENLARSFLFSVLASLGDLESLDHGPDCRPDLFLCLETLAKAHDPDALRSTMHEAAACPSCRRLVFRTVRLQSLFATDTRPQVQPVPALLAELAPRKRSTAGGKVSTFVPIPVRARPPRGPGLVRSVMPALILAGFIWLLFQLFHDNLVAALTPTAALRRDGPADTPARSGFVRHQAPAIMGTYRSASVAGAPLFPEQEVSSSLAGEATVEFLTGPVATLWKQTAMVARPTGLTLLRGTVGLLFDREPEGDWTLVTPDVTVTTKGRSLLVHTAPGKGTLVGLRGGRASVRLRDGTVVVLEGEEQLQVTGATKYQKRVGVVESDFAVGHGGRPGTGSSDASVAAGTPAAPRRVDLTALRERVATGIHHSPDVNPPPLRSTAQNVEEGDTKPRTWRDYF